ncbi:MAG: hypothetical protein LUG58_07295, partial [Clostridiales bacterium]|nr:hypothetical protein [Clostridiales bacterium]
IFVLNVFCFVWLVFFCFYLTGLWGPVEPSPHPGRPRAAPTGERGNWFRMQELSLTCKTPNASRTSLVAIIPQKVGGVEPVLKKNRYLPDPKLCETCATKCVFSLVFSLFRRFSQKSDRWFRISTVLLRETGACIRDFTG